MSRIDELLLRRGRLIERIAGQRETLGRELAPVAGALDKIDLALVGIQCGADYLRRHALLSTALAGAFLVFKGKTALRWGRRAFSLWKSWRALQSALASLESRIRP